MKMAQSTEWGKKVIYSFNFFGVTDSECAFSALVVSPSVSILLCCFPSCLSYFFWSLLFSVLSFSITCLCFPAPFVFSQSSPFLFFYDLSCSLCSQLSLLSVAVWISYLLSPSSSHYSLSLDLFLFSFTNDSYTVPCVSPSCCPTIYLCPPLHMYDFRSVR